MNSIQFHSPSDCFNDLNRFQHNEECKLTDNLGRNLQNIYKNQPGSSKDTRIYQVKFKSGVRYYLAKNEDTNRYKLDDVVIVEADRGIDLGLIKGFFTYAMYYEARRQHCVRCGSLGIKDEDGSWDLKYINGLASKNDIQLLAIKTIEEAAVTQRARQLVCYKYNLPIQIIDSDFQFDRKKLTIVYESKMRVDFRNLVIELFGAFKVRIWMKPLDMESDYSSDYDDDNNDVANSKVNYNHTQCGSYNSYSRSSNLDASENYGGTSYYRSHLPVGKYINN